MATPAFAQAAVIERTLERVAERCPDPTAAVYARLFAEQPAMRAHFWRDGTGTIKGEMLARTFEAILDFVGPRRYADHMISTEMVTHEGYDIPREVFATFFGVVAGAVREILGEDWTAEMEGAWSALLHEIAGFVAMTPRTDTSNPYFEALTAAFEREHAASPA